MRRRDFLVATVGVGTAALAGCTDSDDPATNSPATPAPAVTDHSFEMVDPSETPDEPQLVAVEEGRFEVAGTATVSDGCTSLAVGAAPEFVDGGREVKMMVGTRKQTEGMCTQAIRDIGYRLAVEYDGDAPERVTVAQAGRDSGTVELDPSVATRDGQ